MDENSFISELSPIGNAIGESNYGRCVTLQITRCDPPAASLCVRLGGPGSEWHTVDLPMTQPLTIHRATNVRVLRRVTELAMATPSYLQTLAADGDDVGPSDEMAVMDVLSSMVSTVAGSTVVTAIPGGGAGGDDGIETELVAAAGAGDNAPLRVRFRWAIGEVLSSAPVASTEEAVAEHGVAQVAFHVLSDDGIADMEDNTKAETEAPGSALLNGSAEIENFLREEKGDGHNDHKDEDTPILVGDEAPTSNDLTGLFPFTPRCPQVPATALDAPTLSGVLDVHAHVYHHAVTVANSTSTKPFIDVIEVPSSNRGSATDHDVVKVRRNGSDALHARSPITGRPARVGPLTLPNDVSNGTGDPFAVSFTDNELTQNDETSTDAAFGRSSSSRSNTPRRQRPRSARRSTVQISLAPAMEDTLEPKKHDGGESAASTENSVHISDDDEHDIPLQEMHRPIPTPLPSAAKEDEAPVSAHALHVANPVGQSWATPSKVEHMQAVAPPITTSRPTVDNLFDGVAANELLVSVAVVGVINTKSTADPHRVVSVNINARSVASKMTDGTMISSECVSFQTAPTLRSLAAVVPQMSTPALLCPSQHNKENTEDESERDDEQSSKRIVQLNVVCTVMEVISANGTTASTELWRAGEEVDTDDAKYSPFSTSPIIKEMCFSGANGDVVVTQWTYITVGDYRDAVLNLRCRADEPGQPTLQVLLVADEDKVHKKMDVISNNNNNNVQLQVSVPVHVAVSAPGLQANAVQHRWTTAATVEGLLQQPIRIPLQDPLGYIAFYTTPLSQHQQQTTDNLKDVAYVEPLFFRGFADKWTRAITHRHPAITLYYRIVAPAASLVLPTLVPQLPNLFYEPMKKLQGNCNDSAKVLREILISVKAPSSLLTSVFTMQPAVASQVTPLPSPEDADPAATAAAPASLPPSVSSWSLVLRHAVTHAVLAETVATATTAPTLTYRYFLPLSEEETSNNMGNQTQALTTPTTPHETSSPSCLPWELVLFPCTSTAITNGTTSSSSLTPTPARHLPTPPTNRAACRSSRGAIHNAGMTAANKQHAIDDSDTVAWSGAMYLSYAQLSTTAAVPGTTRSFRAYICVSAPSSSTSNTSPSQSGSTPLGAQVEVSCDVRRHSLDAHSAVFCLRSLRLVASPIAAPQLSPSAQVSLPPSQVRLWFSTSGSSTEDVQSTWSASPSEKPSVRDLQRAWAPKLSSPYASGSSPYLRTDAHGRIIWTGAPVLLSTVNTRARLCVAVVPDSVGAATSNSAPPQSSANAVTSTAEGEEALRRCVMALRKRAIHRYKKSHMFSDHKEGEENFGEGGQENSPSELALAEMYLQCLSAVAMRAENYVEVDLQPSLVAASERQGHSRHRLLLSSVSGNIRLSRSVVLELQGQWIKLPRKVVQLSQAYVPSPRLWALRCSYVMRRTGVEVRDDPKAPPQPALISESGRVPLAQEVLEAECGCDVTASSVPLDYADPSEEMVQKMLPGLSYDNLVVQMKRMDRRLQPFRETIAISAAANMHDESKMPEETSELLEHIFGPNGVAHSIYIADASHKVAVVQFVFGDAYTTKTVLNVSCTAVGSLAATPSQKPHEHSRNGHTTSSLHGGTSAVKHRFPSSSVPSHASPTVQVVCDSLTRSSTLHDFLPEAVVARFFPGVSHRRYPPELMWYHGDRAIAADTEQQRREEGQTAWQRGLTEQSLGPYQKPGSMVVSAVAHHPYESLPLMVESSLTRCFDGRSLFVFGGISTTTGIASSRAFVLDVSSQKWLALRTQKGGDHHNCNEIAPRYGHSAVFRPSDGAVYVYGGRGRPHESGGGTSGDLKSGPTPSNDVFSDVLKLEWNIVTATVEATQVTCTMAETPSFTTSSLSFAAAPSEPGILARWRHVAVLHDDYLVVLGGLSGSGTAYSCSELMCLDMKTREWCVRRSFGADTPSPRYGHAAAVSDSMSLYVFGGWTPTAGNGPTRPAASSRSDDDSSRNSGAVLDEDVAVADFYKMDLITCMWSRVTPNGLLRPPALELADMTACRIDDCPVLFLVGGRAANNASVPTTDADDDGALANLEIFLFSTATLFWRRVKMDCTPVPARFGLRAVVSSVAPTKAAAATTANGHVDGLSAFTESARLRRGLPSRGQRLGNIVIVGGLPLSESAVVDTSPAITLLLTAVHGSTNGAAITTANHRDVSNGQRTGEGTRSPSVGQQRQSPRGPAHSIPRRPATSPPRLAPRRSVLSKMTSTQSPRRRVGGHDDDYVRNPPLTASMRSPFAAGRSAHRWQSASMPGRYVGGTGGRTTIPFNPERPSCYSTLTRRQQRQLIRRLYITDIQMRAANLETLEEQVLLERMPQVFQSSCSRSHSRSPRTQTISTARPTRVSSVPIQRSAYDPTPLTKDGSAGKKIDTAEVSAEAMSVPTTHRDLRSALLARSNSSSSMTESLPSSSSLSLTSSARSNSEGDECGAADSNKKEEPTQESAPEKSALPEHDLNGDKGDVNESLSNKSEVEKTKNEKDENNEYEDSFVSTSADDDDAADGGSSVHAKAAQDVAHLLPRSVSSHIEPRGSNHGARDDENPASAPLNMSSLANSSRGALATTQSGKAATEHPHSSLQSTALLSNVSKPSIPAARDVADTHSISSSEELKLEEHMAAKAQEEEEKEKEANFSHHSSPHSASAIAFKDGDHAHKEQTGEDGEEGRRKDLSASASAHSSAVLPLPVLPIASESDVFMRGGYNRASNASAVSSSYAASVKEGGEKEEEEEEDQTPLHDHEAPVAPHTPKAPAAAVASDEREDEMLTSTSASHENYTVNEVVLKTPTPADDLIVPSKDDQTGDDEGEAEEKEEEDQADEDYNDEDNNWESLSGDDEVESKAASSHVKTPPIVESNDDAEAVAAVVDGKEYEEGMLTPPPAPREHPTPPESSLSSSLASAPPISHPMSDEDEMMSEVESDVESEGDGEAQAKMSDASISSELPVPASVASVGEDEGVMQHFLAPTPPMSEASEVYEEEAEEPEETPEVVVEDHKEPSDAFSEVYDDDFSDAAEGSAVPLAKSPTPVASEDAVHSEGAALAKAPSALASEVDSEQQDVEDDIDDTSITPIPSEVFSNAPEDTSEEAAKQQTRVQPGMEVSPMTQELGDVKPIKTFAAASDFSFDAHGEDNGDGDFEEAAAEQKVTTPAASVSLCSVDNIKEANIGNRSEFSSSSHVSTPKVSEPQEEHSIDLPEEHEPPLETSAEYQQEVNEELKVPSPPESAEMSSDRDNGKTEEEEETPELPPLHSPTSSASEHVAHKTENDEHPDGTHADSSTSAESNAEPREEEMETVESPRPLTPFVPLEEFSHSSAHIPIFISHSNDGIDANPPEAPAMQNRESPPMTPLLEEEEKKTKTPMQPSDAPSTLHDKAELQQQQQSLSDVASYGSAAIRMEEEEDEEKESSVSVVSSCKHVASVEELEAELSAHENAAEDAADAVGAHPYELSSEHPPHLHKPVELAELSIHQDEAVELSAAAPPTPEDSAELVSAPMPIPVTNSENEQQKEEDDEGEEEDDHAEPPSATSVKSDALEAHEVHVPDSLERLSAEEEEMEADNTHDEGPVVVPHERSDMDASKEQIEAAAPLSSLSALEVLVDASQTSSDLSDDAEGRVPSHHSHNGSDVRAALIEMKRHDATSSHGEEGDGELGGSKARETQATPDAARDGDIIPAAGNPLEHFSATSEASESSVKPAEGAEELSDAANVSEPAPEAVTAAPPPVMFLKGEATESVEEAEEEEGNDSDDREDAAAATGDGEAPIDSSNELTALAGRSHSSTDGANVFVPHVIQETLSHDSAPEAIEGKSKGENNKQQDGVALHMDKDDNNMHDPSTLMAVEPPTFNDDDELSSSAVAPEQHEHIERNAGTPFPAVIPNYDEEEDVEVSSGSQPASNAVVSPIFGDVDHALNSFTTHGDEEGDDAREELDSAPDVANGNYPSVPIEKGTHDVDAEAVRNGRHATATPALNADEWGKELSTPPKRLPATPTDEEAKLNDGRDLLDRRRGVEEEVRDDDFDF